MDRPMEMTTKQEMRSDIRVALRGIQIAMIVLIITSISAIFYPILAWGNLATAIIGIYFETKIEKQMRKREEEDQKETTNDKNE